VRVICEHQAAISTYFAAVYVLLLSLQPKEPKESDESGAFARLNADEDAATEGDRRLLTAQHSLLAEASALLSKGISRHLLQKTEPKEPKEVSACALAMRMHTDLLTERVDFKHREGHSPAPGLRTCNLVQSNATEAQNPQSEGCRLNYGLTIRCATLD
jgi:hypothetical protein